MLKCKACLRTKFKCVCVTMCSLVISLFSRDLYLNGNRPKYQQCFNLLTRVQYLHSAWFLNGRTSITSILVYFYRVCSCKILTFIHQNTVARYFLLGLATYLRRSKGSICSYKLPKIVYDVSINVHSYQI